MIVFDTIYIYKYIIYIVSYWQTQQIKVPTKISEKNSMIFHDFSRPKSKFPDKKYQYLFLEPMYQFVESITDRHRCTLTHKHTHTSFDQDQLTIQLISLVIDLIQEVKTTLVNLIKMDNRFSY